MPQRIHERPIARSPPFLHNGTSGPNYPPLN